VTEEAAYLVVARFVKPHGMAGDALVFPMTDRPDEVFAPGRELFPVTEDGSLDGGSALKIARGRVHARRWLLKFDGIDDRTTVEGWPAGYFGVRQDELDPPASDEMYEHEVPGATVVEGDEIIGTAKGLMGPDGNRLLIVDRDGKDVLVPFRAPILIDMDRDARRIRVALPPGLLEL
jgi:16S rRNA processing protein RimM